jgi:hypothetical protein
MVWIILHMLIQNKHSFDSFNAVFETNIALPSLQVSFIINIILFHVNHFKSFDTTLTWLCDLLMGWRSVNPQMNEIMRFPWRLSQTRDQHMDWLKESANMYPHEVEVCECQNQMSPRFLSWIPSLRIGNHEVFQFFGSKLHGPNLI